MMRTRSRAGALKIELAQSARRGRGADLRFRVFGHIDGHYSLSVVNRGLALGLDRGPGSVLVNHYHGARVAGLPTDMTVDQARRIGQMIQGWDSASDDDSERISIYQHYPLTRDERPARLRIAFFFWEESTVPRQVVDHFNENFAAVLVSSEFVRKVFRDSGCRLPIKVVPLGIDHIIAAEPNRIAELEAATPRRFRFLHVSSAFPRKGIDILLKAYDAEFSGSDPVELVIKTFPNEHNDLHDQIARLRQDRSDPPRILVDEQRRSEGELAWLYGTADAVVLPTRGEGFNLPAAEAMALGRPVISTAYGGQADFLTDETGWCLPFDFAPSRTHLATDGSLWLEPRTDDLRRLMRRFFDPETRTDIAAEASIRSEAARRLVRSVYRWSNTAMLIRDYSAAILAAAEQARPDAIRLAIVSSWATACGVAEYTRMLLEGFHAERFACTHFCDTRTAAAEGVHPLFALGMPDSFAACCDAIAARPFDAIIVQHQQSQFDILAAASHLARLQKQAPVFLTLHATRFLSDVDTASLSRLAETLANLERIVVHTLADQHALKRIGLVNNVVVIPQGIAAGRPDDTSARLDPAGRRAFLIARFGRDSGPAVPALRPDLPQRLATGAFWIGTFGFLLPHKGLREIVEAVRILHEAGQTQVRALLLCAALDARSEPLFAEIESLIAASGLKGAVILVRDFLPMADASALLGAMDLNVFAYHHTGESSSAAVRAAAATGRPILTTPLPIFEELSPFAFTTAGTDGESLARTVSSLITDPATLNGRGEAQARWIEARNWERISARHANIIQGVVAERRIGARSESGPTLQAMPLSHDGEARPLCPPGIPLPFTGRTRPWLSRVYHLGLSETPSIFGSELAGASTAVIWSATDLELARPASGAAALHLDRRDRGVLDEGILLIAAQALADIPPSQRSAVFAYARRHGMRSLLEQAPTAESDGLPLLADVIVTSDAGARNALGTLPVQTFTWPQTLTNVPGAGRSPRREAATLRGLSMVGFDGPDTPLVAAIRAEAEADALAGRPDIFRFGEIRSEAPAWIAVSGAMGRASALQTLASVGQDRRLALFMDERAVEAWCAGEGAAVDLVGSACAIIFETAHAYRTFFAVLSRRSGSVALVRRRASLIEAGPGETRDDLVDRFARVLRLARPIRPAELVSAFPLLAEPPFPRGEKRLSVCVSTYNRAAWLRVTLPLLAKDIAGNRAIEFLVVDNASTDETPDVLEELAPALGFRWVRNADNVGMLGNLAVTVRLSRGDYVWILGDDDLVRPGTVDKVLTALDEAPRTELLYLNYAYTLFNDPAQLVDPSGLMKEATPIAPETPTGFSETISRFAANNENFFTAIYACIFRRDHAIAAYTQNTEGPPFSSLSTCIPTTKYVLEHMMDRPGYWIGSHQIIVNMNVSWMRFALVWHMECLTETMDLAEARGADPEDLMQYRKRNIGQVAHFMGERFSEDNGARALLSMARYIETAKRVDDLPKQANILVASYDHVTNCQSARSDELATATIRALYGL